MNIKRTFFISDYEVETFKEVLGGKFCKNGPHFELENGDILYRFSVRESRWTIWYDIWYHKRFNWKGNQNV